jgi:hypothetical protein
MEVDKAFPQTQWAWSDFYGDGALVDDGVIVCFELPVRYSSSDSEASLTRSLSLRILWDTFSTGCVYT